jgi:hypothetical protein
MLKRITTSFHPSSSLNPNSSRSSSSNAHGAIKYPTREATTAGAQKMQALPLNLNAVATTLARLSDGDQMQNQQHRHDELKALKNSISQANLATEDKKDVEHLAASTLASGFAKIDEETNLKDYFAAFIDFFKNSDGDKFVNNLGRALKDAASIGDQAQRLQTVGTVLQKWLNNEENKTSSKYLPVLGLQLKMAEFEGSQLSRFPEERRRSSLNTYASLHARASLIAGAGEVIKQKFEVDKDPKEGVKALLESLNLFTKEDRSNLLATLAEKKELVYSTLKKNVGRKFCLLGSVSTIRTCR